MKKEFSSQEPLDPRLISLLNLLNETPERDPDLVAQSREKYLTELDMLALPSREPSALKRFLVGLGFTANHQNIKENKSMSTNKLRLAVTTLAILVLVVIVLFGGSTATVLAAQNSIPGDTLYPIKTTMERTRLSLTRTADGRIDLQMDYAEQRLAEIQALIGEGRYEKIGPATLAFEAHILNALNELDSLATENPALASSLMARITESLSQYAAALTTFAERVPESIRMDLEKTISSLGGGDNGNFNLNENLNMNSNDSFDDNRNDTFEFDYDDNENFNDSYDDDDDDDDGYNDNYNDSYDEDDDDDGYNDNYNDSYDDDDDDDGYNDNYNDTYDDDDDDDGYNDNYNDSYDDDDDDDDDDDSYNNNYNDSDDDDDDDD